MKLGKFLKGVINKIRGRVSPEEYNKQKAGYSGYSGYPLPETTKDIDEIDDEVFEAEIIIPCIIQTPQHRKNKIWYYKKQTGGFNTTTKKFTPYSLAGGHTVQFRSIKQFRGSVVKYL